MVVKNYLYSFIKYMMVFFFFCTIILDKGESIYAESSKSAILMEQKTGRILYEKDAYKKRKIASITKIMTAIIALESNKLDQLVEITQEMIETEGSSIYLEVGEKITLRELIYGLLLRSGNDAAQAIAIFVAGDMAEFVHMMNEKAAWIGMNNTSFTNPHGLDDGDLHGSSAYDMALLTRYAMQNKDFCAISKTKKFTTSSESLNWQRVWHNKNKMLTKYYPYSTGGKTGFTKKAGRTLVSTATNNKLDLIVVTIDDPNDWQDHMELFDNGFSSYSMKIFARAGQLQDVEDKVYKQQLYLHSDLVYPLAKGEEENFNLVYVLNKKKNQEQGEKEQKEIVGRIELVFNEKVVSELPIYYHHAVKKEKNDEKQSMNESLKKLLGYFFGVSEHG